jgi:23S rRNA G2445 N2-methylase RlmL
MMPTYLKLTYIPGLGEIVIRELKSFPGFKVAETTETGVFIDLPSELKRVRELRSVNSVFIVKRDEALNPLYISRHKSILGGMIEFMFKQKTDTFKTFAVSCAGSDSDEVKEIKKFVAQTFKLEESEDADLKIYIGKYGTTWEVGVELFARPLSLRDYKVENIKGGMNPTIAFAMNSLCHLEKKESYLNIFSGSATLLIEAGVTNPKLKLVGFDHNGTSIALAVKNIKKAGLIKNIELKNADIFDEPELGTFDVIASDVPFGMQIAKGEDLEKLYEMFIAYAEKVLNPEGRLVVYTTEHELLEAVISRSSFKVLKTMSLKVSTVVAPTVYIEPKIFLCERK